MAEAPRASVWIGRATFFAVATVLVFLRLLPLDTLPRGWAPPDLLLAVTCAYAVRRPDFVPVWLIATVFLLTDLLFQRPPGLMTALVVVATEMLRKRANGLRSLPIYIEWATVAAALVIVALGQRIVLWVVMLPQAPLGLALIDLALTVLVYPLVVAVALVLLGLRRPAPGEVDALGHRL